MVRQFGVSMGVVYWINPAENYIYWWNTVTGESGRTTPTKSYGVGYADGINNPNFDFEFLGAETGSGAMAQDWYGNLVHMWNDGLNGWGNTSGTHFVKGYAVYKSATEYGKLIDFIPKLSKMNDTGRASYPFYRRLINESDGKLTGSSTSDLSNYEYFAPTSNTPNPNYPARSVDWANKYYHKANTNITKEPTDFLGVSGNLWGKGYLQGSTELAPSSYYNGYSTGQIFHACDTIVYGNMFADGQYTNWYLNYTLTVGNRTSPGYYPWNGLWKSTYRSGYWHPRDYSFETAPTEYFFMESDVLEYFWSVPYAGLAEYSATRDGNKWQGYVDDLNYSSYIGTTSANRHKSDQMSSPEIDSIKGTRVIVHNYWLQWMPFDISDTDSDANKRNGSIIIQYSKYADSNGNNPMSTTSAPVFTGSPTRKYAPIGYSYGWAETDAATKLATPTPNFPVKFQNTTVSSWNELERVNDNVFALYTHVPGRGFAKYFITAVKPNNAVSNLKVAKQYMNANNQVVNQLTWTPQAYDRSTMHTYEVWYRRKRSGASEYKDYRTIDGTSGAVWNFAGKASVKYNGATDSTITSSGNKSGMMPNKTFYDSYTAESCTFEHVAPHDTDGSNNYDMVYEYMIIPLYDRSAHRGTESAVVTSTTKAPSCPVTGTFAQVTDKNANGETLYGFSVQLDSKVDITKTGANSAQIMLIVPQDDVTKTALAENTSVTVSTGDVSESTSASATYSIMGTNDFTVNGYHVVVDGFSVGENGELPTVTWHNINPDKEYKVKVYVVRTSSSYFIPSDVLATTLYVPELVWSTTPANFYKLVGDYGSLTGNEDMPIGSFRRIDPATNALDENPSNPVTLNNANYYGTNGSTLKPVFVTEEVLGKLNNGVYENAGWEVAYGIYIYDENGNEFAKMQLKEQLESAEYAACYSNINDVICDAIGLKVDYKEETGEDGRTRKVYTPTNKTYTAKVDVAYRRLNAEGNRDGLEVIKSTYADLVIGSTSLSGLDVTNKAGGSVLGALHQRSGSHFYYDNATTNGYYPYYYDAAMLLDWTEDNTLNRYMGYYGASKAVCYGHYETPDKNPDAWVQYHAGSILTDDEVTSLNNSNAALTDGAIGYDGSNNWSAQAIENNKVPMLVHYVYGANAPLASDETAVSEIKFDVTLTAEYPIVNYTGLNAGFMVAEDPTTYDIPLESGTMNVMTVPTPLSNMYVNSISVTTGVEGIITNAAGGVVLYPNPVGSTFTLQAPMAMGEVKIFTMEGQLVKVVKDINDTMVSINVDELPQGMYIVNTLGIAKIMIKQ
ncbi:MAG: T9SS type A sorting domain-containing protein [Muribaculaceae bacterium]|nr:T9SS type A sorting domain-containing protein [Muribaculaceae bacterium]